MVLADHQIEWLVDKFGSTIEPYNPENLQPSSYDVTLGNTFKIMQWSEEPLDPFNQSQLDKAYYTLRRNDGEAFVLPPGQFVLAATKERVAVPPDLVCRLEGRSSVGRLGITVHITAGYIDPGFIGNITLEMMSFAPRPIILTPGMRVAQIGFLKMAAPARTPYKGRYQGDTTVAHSRYGQGEQRTMHVYCSECGKGPQPVRGPIENGDFISELTCECGKTLPINIHMEDQHNEQ